MHMKTNTPSLWTEHNLFYSGVFSFKGLLTTEIRIWRERFTTNWWRLCYFLKKWFHTSIYAFMEDIDIVCCMFQKPIQSMFCICYCKQKFHCHKISLLLCRLPHYSNLLPLLNSPSAFEMKYSLSRALLTSAWWLIPWWYHHPRKYLCMFAETFRPCAEKDFSTENNKTL